MTYRRSNSINGRMFLLETLQSIQNYNVTWIHTLNKTNKQLEHAHMHVHYGWVILK